MCINICIEGLFSINGESHIHELLSNSGSRRSFHFDAIASFFLTVRGAVINLYTPYDLIFGVISTISAIENCVCVCVCVCSSWGDSNSILRDRLKL